MTAISLALILAAMLAQQSEPTETGRRPPMFEKDVIRTSAGDLTMTFVGHGTLVFQFGDTMIHVDPVSSEADYRTMPKADIVLVTHEHRDHFDPDVIAQLRKPETTVLLTGGCTPAPSGSTVMKNGDTQTVRGIRVEAVPAYNIIHKRPSGDPFHPRGVGNGYLLTFGDTRVYVAGDTESIPEMAELKDIAVAFLPMNLPYTMSPEMVADAARAFRPRMLYPYHFGDTDTSALVRLLSDEKAIDVRIRKMQ